MAEGLFVDGRRKDDPVGLAHPLHDGLRVIPVRAVLLPLRDADGAPPARQKVRVPQPQVLELDCTVRLHEFANPFGSPIYIPLSRAAHDDEDLHRCLQNRSLRPAS